MGPYASSARSRRGAYLLALILTAGLLHGLLYMFLVPPWQHYDEPGHFEFAWLLADRGRIPSEGDFDQEMRRQVAASMVEHRFFDQLDNRPDLISQTEPVWIGISQINLSFMYYGLVSLPLRIFHFADITFQLYVARLVSLLLYLVTLCAACGLIAEITPPGHPLRFLLPATLVLLPGFVDMMTAVSDDVGATVSLSLCLWAAIRIVQRGFSWTRLVLLSLATVVCLFTKITVAVAIPISGAALAFSLLRSGLRPLAWGLLFAGALGSVVAVLSWGDAAHWSRQTPQPGLTRVRLEEAPSGRFAFQVLSLPGEETHRIIQLLPSDTVRSLQGKPVTLGVWMWSSQPVNAQTPSLFIGGRQVSYEVELTQQPAFFAFNARVNKQANTMYITLDPGTIASKAPVTIYYDGLALVEGRMNIAKSPEYTAASAQKGVWGDYPFTNLLRNPSAETAGPFVRPWAESQMTRKFPGQPSLSLALSTLTDWSPAAWYYQLASKNLFETFWARLGWGHVPLIAGSIIYKLLGAITLLGFLGGLAALLRRRRCVLPWASLAVLVIALLGVWMPTLMRGINSLVGEIFMPAARYAFPAVIPTILVLCAGWLEIFHGISVRIKFSLRDFYVVYSLALFGLGVLALASLMRFYR